jgi:hypothetical protein
VQSRSPLKSEGAGNAGRFSLDQDQGAVGIFLFPKQPQFDLEMTTMAETTKLSVETALNKLREADAQKSSSTRHEEQTEALDEEISRMRAQRLRLEAHQRRSAKPR